jgi:hypothetical protein
MFAPDHLRAKYFEFNKYGLATLKKEFRNPEELQKKKKDRRIKNASLASKTNPESC